jgi:RNA polymerase sigma factor (sigma-70 family)
LDPRVFVRVSPDILEILRRVVRSRLTGEAARLVDDAVGDACVRLLRALERTTPDDLEAYVASIAERAAIDQMRRLRRERLRLTSIEQAHDMTAPPTARAWDPSRAIRFLVLQFFAERRPECAPLALAHFRGEPWQAVARRMGVPDPTVRQRWKRCRAYFLESLRADPGSFGPLLELLDDD